MSSSGASVSTLFSLTFSSLSTHSTIETSLFLPSVPPVLRSFQTSQSFSSLPTATRYEHTECAEGESEGGRNEAQKKKKREPSSSMKIGIIVIFNLSLSRSLSRQISSISHVSDACEVVFGLNVISMRFVHRRKAATEGSLTGESFSRRSVEKTFSSHPPLSLSLTHHSLPLPPPFPRNLPLYSIKKFI